MDMFQLQCFLSIARYKSFTEASYQISISQSALSKHIGKLEDELKVRLFDRSKRQTELTPAGKEFARYAETILASYEQARSAMKKFALGGVLHIGSVEHMGRVGLTTPIASFLNQFPEGEVEIKIENSGTIDLLNLLTARKIDVAFIAYITSALKDISNLDNFDISLYHLYQLVMDDYHLVVSRSHPLAGEKLVSWQQLAEERFVILDKSFSLNALLRHSFRQMGLNPHIAFESDQVDTILGLVEENFGVTMLSKRIAMTRYNVVPIPMEHPLSRNTVLVVPRELEQKQKLVRHFVRHMVDYFQSSPAE